MWKPLWVQKEFDRYAEQTARPVRWRHLIGFAAVGIFLLRLPDDPWSAFGVAAVLLCLALALANRHESLQYFRTRGIDPYNKQQVKEDRARLYRTWGIPDPDEQPLITRIFAAIGSLLLLGTVLPLLFSENARAVALYLVWHAAKLVIAGASATLAE